MRIGNDELKDGLCNINSNSSSMHDGLLTLKELFPMPMKINTQLLRRTAGESIPSIDTDVLSARFPGLLSAGQLRRLTSAFSNIH